MFRTDFCEINLLKEMIAANWSWPDVIINTTTAHEHRDNIKGTLSIFSNISGAATYGADNTKQKIGADTFFISNEQQLYSIDIDKPVETFNIHFSTDMLQKLLPAVTHSHEAMLDNAGMATAHGFSFYNKQYWKDEYFRNIIGLLKAKSATGELNSLMTEEVLADLLTHIVRQEQQFNSNIRNMQLTKAATRDEMKLRLQNAVDYIYEHYTSSLSLDELAAVACMSKFHFLRVFKQVYGKTPYQFITAVKIDKAKQMLAQTSDSVTDIAYGLGYEDISTFSRVFRQKSGTWPRSYRLAV